MIASQRAIGAGFAAGGVLGLLALVLSQGNVLATVAAAVLGFAIGLGVNLRESA